jgi:protein phosphatase
VIPSERAHLTVTAISHPGMTGKNNEDRYGVSAYYMDTGQTTPSVLAVVADGIGGHRAGEVAAEIAVETISSFVAQSDGSQPVLTLREAIIHAGQAINGTAEGDPNQKGMGSTCACAWVIGSRLYTASVGDSRVYLIREGAIRQLSTDHTWVQEAIDQGLLTIDEARRHPNAHVIRRYLGSRLDVVPDLRLRLRADENDTLAEANQGTPLHPGDNLLLCSDGLTDLVENDEILTALQTHNTRGALEELVRMTNRRGGHDNVTIVTMAVPVIERPTIPITVRPTERHFPAALLAAGALLLVMLALAGGLFWYFFLGEGDADSSPSPTPALQATLFPEQVTPPSVLPAPQETASSPAGGAGKALPTVGEAPGAVTPPLQVTLTPWPTNTTAP